MQLMQRFQWNVSTVLFIIFVGILVYEGIDPDLTHPTDESHEPNDSVQELLLEEIIYNCLRCEY